jgi:hypothetical protein
MLQIDRECNKKIIIFSENIILPIKFQRLSRE